MYVKFLDGCLRHKLTCNTHRTLDIVAVSNIVVPNIDAHSVSPDAMVVPRQAKAFLPSFHSSL
ncbi:hypothetical protein SFRURICE_011232 [Spodoptera frugiperda]|nr:hypothetical protein SFRURICE_011232 [Spodoptera frugiperda]